MSNGSPSSNGAGRSAHPVTRPLPSPAARPAAPAGGAAGSGGRALHYLGLALIALMVLGAGAAVPFLRSDPLVWSLTVLFAGVTGASGGAMAGITLVVFGGARGRRGMLVAGLVVGLASFALLAVIVGWAIQRDASGR